jgi:hypothetical protein
MATGPALTQDQNILPVQAYFNLDGTFNTFIGQGQPFVITATESIGINNTNVNATLYPTFTSATSGQVTGLAIASPSLTWNPGTGVFSAPTFFGTLNGTANTANNLSGGGAGQIVYQNALGSTAYLAAGSTGQFLLSNGTSAPSWATVATSVTIADQTTDTATYYPLFYSATSGSTNTVETSSTKLQYQPSTGKFTATLFSGSGASLTNIPNSALTNNSVTIGSTSIALGATSTTLAGLTSVTATSFIGALTGNADTATTATNATNSVITDNTSSSATWYPTLVASTSGNQALTSSSTKLSFQPSTSTLTASIFNGAANNISGGAVNRIPVQSAASATTFIIAPTTASTVLSWSGSAFTWVGIGGGTMVYPAAGIPNSTGTSWTTSYSTSGTGTIVALATSPVFVTPTLGVATATSLAATTITENGFANVNQSDIGTRANQIPLNQYLGTMAWQDAKAVRLGGDAIINTLTVGLGSGSVATNTATGYQALNANTTGANNTGFGYQAGILITSGSNNTLNGYRALYALTTGTRNTAIGSSSLLTVSTGSYNTAIGNAALQSTTGSYSTAIGDFALQANTSGSGCAVGQGVLQSNTTGTSNVGFGGFDGSNNSRTLGLNVSGSGNSAYGFGALAVTTGSNNTGIGYQAGLTLTSGSNNLLLGYNSQASSATVSNEITIGNSSNTVIRYPHSYSTVASLPSASTVGRGSRTFVTDALAPAFQATVVGGGAVFTPVYSDGSVWKVG